MKGRIFNIQHFSLHDGPGIRTTVFLKGCPLRCVWCHNPEGIHTEVQTVFNKEKCIRCGTCGGIHDEKTAADCPSQAVENIGRDISSHELIKEILKDRDFYETSGGGVTFSGGEPLFQVRFLKEILQKCAKEGIHTAVDTSGYAAEEKFRQINDLTGLYLYDIKLMNDELHKKYTGVSNRLILNNLRFLSDSGKRIFIRIPLIPSTTDTDENIISIIKYLKNINFEQINLLSYHRHAESKYIRLGLKFGADIIDNPSDKIHEIKEMFISEGFKTVTGG